METVNTSADGKKLSFVRETSGKLAELHRQQKKALREKQKADREKFREVQQLEISQLNQAQETQIQKIAGEFMNLMKGTEGIVKPDPAAQTITATFKGNNKGGKGK